jgi:hypothetical protein
MTFLKYAVLQGKVVHHSIKMKEILMELTKCTPKQNVFETYITLPGRSEVSLAAATPWRLHLRAVLTELSWQAICLYIGLLLVRTLPFLQPCELISYVLALLLAAL